MTTTTMQLQSRTLNLRAEHHESQGNTLLASWMRESAEYFQTLKHDIDMALDNMSLGNYELSRRSRREEFASEWYGYEEEYAYNWHGEN